MKYNTLTRSFQIAVVCCCCLNNGRILAFRPSVHPDEKPVIASKKIILPEVLGRGGGAIHAKDVVSPSISSVTSVGRKKWGVDNDQPDEYWFDNRIHTLGNHGFWGAVHAAVAPLTTKIIDVAAYNGEDIRQMLAQELSKIVIKKEARVVDLCCGTGFSTRALQKAFPEAATVLGIDTSAEMISMAKFLTKHIADVKPVFDSIAFKVVDRYRSMQDTVCTCNNASFAQRNAEDTKLPDRSFDLVTVMWGFHEAPMQGREKIIQEARRLLSPGGTLAVVDISTDYVPSEHMLRGEPYVQEYQQNIHKQLKKNKGFHSTKYQTIVPKHLGMWTLTRSATA